MHSLNRHIRYTHSRDHEILRTFECQICKKVFPEKNSLETHVRIHTGERPFTCVQCGRSFSDQSALINHNKTHLSNRQTIPCEYCGSLFYQRKNIKAHFKVCKLSEIGGNGSPKKKNHVCKKCGKGCVSKYNLKKHIKDIHTDIEHKKPITMNTYGKEFKDNVGKYALEYSVDKARYRFNVPAGTIRR